MSKSRNELLQDTLTLKEAEQLQLKYSSKLKIEKNPTFTLLGELKSVCGVDLSYFKKHNKEFGVACAVLWDFNKNKLKHYTFSKNKVKFAYHPGFLGFRECNLLARAIEKLPEKPEIIMCDGHGIIHPKRFGEAVQLGFALDTPSIGIAKNPFIGYCEWKQLKRIRGNKEPVLTFNPTSMNNIAPELLGYAICLNDNIKPVFVSIGYKISLDLAIKIALKTSLNHRQPEPIYLADRLSKQKVKNIISS